MRRRASIARSEIGDDVPDTVYMALRSVLEGIDTPRDGRVEGRNAHGFLGIYVANQPPQMDGPPLSHPLRRRLVHVILCSFTGADSCPVHGRLDCVFPADGKAHPGTARATTEVMRSSRAEGPTGLTRNTLRHHR